jgi:thiopeptide-type bacteriocin biosynthesis protein
MPDHQLIRSPAGEGHWPTAGNGPRIDADGVLAVLAGTPLEEAAGRLGVRPADLADAVDTYKKAGEAALRQCADSEWYQVNVRFIDWGTAEQVAVTALGPVLAQLLDQGLAQAWWFTRKAPCWRLRLRPDPARPGSVASVIHPVLDLLVTSNHLQGWQATVYEPEMAAFGMQPGIDIAHTLFHADSRHILEYLRRSGSTPAAGRRELSLLLCSGMLGGARQDWYEQGDVWHRVCQLRPLPPTTPAHRVRRLAGNVRLLLTADPHASGALFGPGKPLAFAAPWITAFDNAGRALRTAADTGTLRRGLRSVLAHHIIFHWNRLGLTSQTQAVLAHAACDTIMYDPEQPAGPHHCDNR